ncbi:MAG TPA: TolC family protein [Bacteroidales bacterium]|jgi:outer membrane protein|nr:TolC family protein [Bacteroidales bacterium]
MKKYLIIITLIITAISGTFAQDKKWTLEDCINYAITNNIGLKRQVLQTETSKTDYLQSKLNLFPSMNAGSDGRIGFGRSVDPTTNLITFKQNISHSYYLTSSVTLFSGFAEMNTLAANRYMVKAGVELEKVQRNALIIDILGQFYRVIYTRGLEAASKMKMELSEEQLKRISSMVATGREAVSKEYEMQSRVSADKLDYTIAQNTADQALTNLRQMLQLGAGEPFDIVVPDLSNILIPDESFDTDSVYAIAAETLPRLKAIEYQLRGNRKQLAAAKGLISPSLTAGGQLFTGFYKVIGEGVGEQDSYSTQLSNNRSQAVFLSLDIPIFNNYRTGRNIRMARIRRDDTELRLEQEKNSLYTEIENACLDFNRGKDEFGAAQSNYDYNLKSFAAVEKKFESGIVDVTDYSAAKTTLFQAETEALRTRLQLMIRRMTLQFYTSGEYEGKFGM